MKPIRPATVSVLVLAILFGLVSAYTVRRLARPKVEAPKTVATIIVPRINLPKYARIRSQDLEIREVGLDEVPEGALTRIPRALYRVVKSTVMSGDPILEDNLYEVGSTPTLADQVPPGYRAVTIAVARGDALDGVLLPESIVDIALTVEEEHPDLPGLGTLTLLRGVRVLATNRQRWRLEERLNQRLRSVTVAVTSEQANKLILAQRYGRLSLTLRNDTLHDAVAADEADYQPGDQIINPRDLLGLPPIEPAPAAIVYKAQIWRGGAVQEVIFQPEQIEEARQATAVTKRQRRGPAIVPTSTQRGRQAKVSVHAEDETNSEHSQDNEMPALGAADGAEQIEDLDTLNAWSTSPKQS